MSNIIKKRKHLGGCLMTAVLLLTSCGNEMSIAGQDNQTETVSVSLTLNIAPETEITTRGSFVDNTNTLESQDIKNLWILQFNGTGEDAQLVGEPTYTPNYTGEMEIRLIASRTSNRLVFIANTFSSTIAFGSCKTFGALKEFFSSVSTESDVVHSESVDGVTTYFPQMCGTVESLISSSTVISTSLTHTTSRLDITVINGIPDRLTIDNVSVCSVSAHNYFFTNYTLPDTFPDISKPLTTDFPTITWTDGESTHSYTFYVPAHKTGIFSQCTSQQARPLYAPTQATYFRIKAHAMVDSERQDYTYSFFPGWGNNEPGNFNLLPNTRYVYSFSINSIGDQAQDARVNNISLVDFTNRELANTYIINPPVDDGVWTSYRIPLTRIYEFWRIDGKYEDDEVLASLPYGWKADVVWSDFELNETTNFKWENRESSLPLDSYNDYLQFSIPKGTDGIVVVGVKPKKSDGSVDDIYAWSWLLWITGYNPDAKQHYRIDPSDGRYFYQVPGGEVHRYNTPHFQEGGMYSDKVMMDRNIGMSNSTNVDMEKRGCSLYFQFGRKDPFPNDMYIYPEGKTPKVKCKNMIDKLKIHYKDSELGLDGRNMKYSILHPMVFILVPIDKPGGYRANDGWTCDDIYNPAIHDPDIVWQDPYVRTDDGKSVFDPCPPGWKVPDANTFVGRSADHIAYKSPINLGVNYWPNGKVDFFNDLIFFPNSAQINFADTIYWLARGHHGTYAHFLSSKSSDYRTCIEMLDIHYNPPYAYPQGGIDKADGCVVRCVSE